VCCAVKVELVWRKIGWKEEELGGRGTEEVRESELI
jgi:hypothetical protein